MDFRTITMVIETGIAIASVVLNIIKEGNAEKTSNSRYLSMKKQ